MKKTILPALAMLIISAVMLSTASYAWFAMGTQVSATNMNVSIKSDSSFLMISESSDIKTIRTDKKTTIGIKDAVADLLPIAHDSASLIDNTGEQPVGKTGDALLASFSDKTNWYYMSSESPDRATGAEDSEVYLKNATGEEGQDGYVAGDDFGAYVYSKKFYIAIADGSNQMTDLKAKVSIKLGDVVGDEALRVVIVSKEAYHTYQLKNTAGEGQDAVWENVDEYDSTIFAKTITDKDVIEVNVYIYYDGNDTSVFTNGFNFITDSSVSVFFSATVGGENTNP